MCCVVFTPVSHVRKLNSSAMWLKFQLKEKRFTSALASSARLCRLSDASYDACSCLLAGLLACFLYTTYILLLKMINSTYKVI